MQLWIIWGIDDIERLDPDLHWEFDPLSYDDFNLNNMLTKGDQR